MASPPDLKKRLLAPPQPFGRTFEAEAADLACAYQTPPNSAMHTPITACHERASCSASIPNATTTNLFKLERTINVVALT